MPFNANANSLLPTISSLVPSGSVLLENNTEKTVGGTSTKQSVTQNLYRIQDQGLIESMSREVLLYNGIWTPDDPIIKSIIADSEIDTDFNQPTLSNQIFSLPGDLFSKSAFLKSKFSAIAFFRANCEITLRVQGSPFEHGILRMAHIPYAKGTSVERRSYNEHLRSLSTFPSVELNMQHPTRSATLHVPYVNEYQVINPSDDDGLSTVRVWVITQLAGMDSAVKCSYSISARLTDVELFGMTPSKTSDKSYENKRIASHETEMKRRPLFNPLELKTQDGEDERATSRGLISTIANTVGSVADVLHDVPVIGEIAKPVSWIANAVGAVASFFGFSKTIDVEKNQVFTNMPARGFTNAVGIDQSVALSLLPNNAIDPTIATFSTEDEMSIEYIAKKEYYYGSQGWNDQDKADHVLFTIPVNPSNFSSHGSTLRGEKVLFTAPIGLVQRLAHYWRGQINVRFNFAKTQFHQGRLLVQYLPYGEGRTSIEETMSHIIDISQVDHEGVSISFPSVQQNKWLRTNDDLDNGWDPACTAGVIVVSVLNPLITTGTVAKWVMIVPSISWSDFEINEQTSISKVAVSTSFDSGYDNTKCTRIASQLVDGKHEISFSVKSRGMAIVTDAVLKGSVDGTTGVYLDNGTVFRKPMCVINNEANRASFTDVMVPLTPGNYTVHNSNAPVSEIYVVVFGDVTVNHGHSEEFDVIYRGQPMVNDQKTLNSGDYVIATNVKESFTVLPSDMSFTESSNSRFIFVSQNDFVVSADYNSVDTTGVSVVTTSKGAIWFVLRKSASLKCQDFQETDESIKMTTMGEIIPSLRFLTRRFTMSDRGHDSSVVIGTPSLSTSKTLRQSLFEVISWMYRFTAGSVRHKIIVDSDETVFAVMANTNSVSKNNGFHPMDVSCAMHIQNASLNPIVEVQQPFYSPAENLAISSTTFDLSAVAVGTFTGNNFEYTVLEAAGDDHTFSFLVGCPVFTVASN